MIKSKRSLQYLKRIARRLPENEQPITTSRFLVIFSVYFRCVEQLFASNER